MLCITIILYILIGSFRYINIQLGHEAERTQTKEQARLLFFNFYCFTLRRVSSQPRYQAEF